MPQPFLNRERTKTEGALQLAQTNPRSRLSARAEICGRGPTRFLLHRTASHSAVSDEQVTFVFRLGRQIGFVPDSDDQ